MLSIEECRELIPDNENYTDAEIEQIRDDMRILAEIALEKYMLEKKGKGLVGRLREKSHKSAYLKFLPNSLPV